MGIVILGAVGWMLFVGTLLARSSERNDKRYRCPWPLCGVQLSKNPLRAYVNDMYGRKLVIVPEKCEGCDELVEWNDNRGVYMRVKS
jgi:hypothetical protein